MSIISEHLGNKILLDWNLNNKDSKIKGLIQSQLNSNLNTNSIAFNIRKNLFCKEKNGDIFYIFKNEKIIKDILIENGYAEINYYDLLKADYNKIKLNEKIKFFIKNNDVFINEIKITNKKGIENNYNFFLKENFIVFYSNSKSDFYINSSKYDILDFKIDKFYNTYWILKCKNKRFFIKSNLALDFIEFNKKDAEFNFDEIFFKFEIDERINCLEYFDIENFYFLDEDYNVLAYELYKKYFFEYNNKIYFIFSEEIEKYSNYIIGKEQIELLNIYNWINVLGLNEFKIDGLNKISTENFQIFENIFKLKFDNTLNGGINFFNSKYATFNKNIKGNGKDFKDYVVLINDEIFNITGNFVFEDYKKGNFKIIITDKEARLFELLNDRYILRKRVKFGKINEFYFCNLKFQYKRFEVFENFNYEFKVSSNDFYPFKTIKDKIYIEEIANDDKTIQNIIDTSNFKDIDSVKLNVDFDGKKIIFYNYFDFEKNGFRYNSIKSRVQANDIFDLKDIVDFQTSSQYIIKNNKLYFRDNGYIIYTKTKNIIFELINDKNYITKFWINNQNKNIYFKNSQNGVEIVETELESDCYVKIPNITDFIDFDDEKIYSDVSVEDDDNLSVCKKFYENMLITNKFLNEPLFFKFYVDSKNIETFQLFDSDNNQQFNYLTEEFKNGFIVYLNIKRNKKYYYNVDDVQYYYVEPIEAYKNIEFEYKFDSNGCIKFKDVQNIKSFKLNSADYFNENIYLYLYNSQTMEVNRIEITNKDINTKFEINLYVDKIQISSNELDFSSFTFVEDYGSSIIENETLIFYKTKREETIFISSIKDEENFSKINFENLMVDFYYSDLHINGTKNLYIKKPNKNSIPIYINSKYNKYVIDTFAIIVPEDDKFYADNFKTPGALMVIAKDVIKDFGIISQKEFYIN